MFSDDKHIDDIKQLLVECKRYLELQKEYTKLELTEKLSILLSTLILLLIMIILGMVALFYFSFTLAYVLAPAVGGLMFSFGIIASIHVLSALLIYNSRKRLIIDPMTRFIATLFLNK